MLCGEAFFQFGVFRCSIRMGSQVVTERETFDPQAASERDQVEVVSAERGRRFAEPVHQIGAVWEVAVFNFAEDGYCRARGFQALDPNHDVDDRFRGESRHGGAANVFDATYYPASDHTIQNCALLFEARRPGFIVRDDVDWLFGDRSHRDGVVLELNPDINHRATPNDTDT